MTSEMRMEACKCVIFDNDGTLVDMPRDENGVFCTMIPYLLLEKEDGAQIEARENEVFRIYSTDWVGTLRSAGYKTSFFNIQLISDYWAELYKDRPYNKKMIELVKSLKRSGIFTAILSNGPKRTIRLGEAMEHMDMILAREDLVKGNDLKPSPEGIFSICQTAKAKLGETLFIGDSHLDWLAAKRAGVKFIAVNFQIQDFEKLVSQITESGHSAEGIISATPDTINDHLEPVLIKNN